MHPDNQLSRDLIITGLVMSSLLLASIIYAFQGSTYSQADECANRVRSAISPYQVQQLISSKNLPPSYSEVKSWCSTELEGYELKIETAKTYREFPRTTDMMY